MKKYLSIILAILLVMSALTGCAGKNNPTKQDNALNTTATDAVLFRGHDRRGDWNVIQYVA